MGLVIEQKTTVNRTIHRKVKGQMTEVLVDRDEYVEPADREHLLKITGYSDAFEMKGFEAGDPPVSMINVEFEIAAGRQKGGRFKYMCRISLNEKSNLQPILKAAKGGDFSPGESVDFDDYIGKVLYASTRITMSAAGNMYVKVAAPRPYEPEDDGDDAPVAAKAKANPFIESDDE